jgi:hypothetical protein
MWLFAGLFSRPQARKTATQLAPQVLQFIARHCLAVPAIRTLHMETHAHRGEQMNHYRGAALLFTLSLLAAVTASADTFSAGISITDEVSAKDTGLPVYHGATTAPKKKRDRDADKEKTDGDSANVELGFGPWGVKVIAAKLVTEDAPEKVAAFYRSELARMGNVVDCSTSQSRIAEIESRKYKSAKRSLDRPVTCDRSRTKKDGYKYKIGTEGDQYVVAITPEGAGSELALVRVMLRAPD